ncbi:gamma-secretase-activating protein isoform X2 [Phascolarctos cinereus]|uniref:Gamma-secretase-activating protein isoform X2 n=1 Tax=Phascolarctos cinereus TaxID=38626 RepID=A0A6P5K5B4_PHACI|nr:gamma-secretase-activating protein isoform X2 [Phascolarctos cinereus]
MLLQLSAAFDLQQDVVPWLAERLSAEAAAPVAGPRAGLDPVENNYETLQVVNVERNGKVIYSCKDSKRNVFFGLYDLQTKKNEHLYTFEKDLQVVSCSVNREKTLLAVSFIQSAKERRNELQPASKCLTLLVEIHPVNNVKVLKAVDSCIWVQFLYPIDERNPFPDSHLLLISEEKYVEQFHIQVFREDENRVVIGNSGHLPRDRVVEDFVWAQWDMSEQRLYYFVLKKSESVLKCIQFYADENFNLIFEVPLDISFGDTGLTLVNFGCEDSQNREMLSKDLNLRVFTSHTGSLCVCYNKKSDAQEQVTYSVFYLHKGYSKTFAAELGTLEHQSMKNITFLNLDYYVAVYLPGHFFHLLNTQHPDLMCYSLFLTGENETMNLIPDGPLQSLSGALAWDWCSGKLFRVNFNQSSLLHFLQNSPLDYERLAVLHCVLAWGRNPKVLEVQIIQWIFENMWTCRAFDPIQEFLIASLYWKFCLDISNMDKLLPHSSLRSWNTVQSFKGYWEKLNSNLEYVKYAKPHLQYNNNVVRREWRNLISEEKKGKRRSTVYFRNILENAVKVISNLEAWIVEPRLALLFQEEDNQQRLLMGLMVSELKEHLLRNLPVQFIGKKKIEQLVLDYVSKMLDLLCQMLETSWRKHNLHSWVFHFDGRGSAGEFAVFHTMTQILDSVNRMCLPLPPGFHTLHMTLGVRCLPLHSLLRYIDDKVLLLTEKGVMKLLKDLDNTEKNEKLKFSIVARLPPFIMQKISQVWDHPVNSHIISRNYVKRLLQKHKRQSRNSTMDKSSFLIEFLPLNYLIEVLTELETARQALNPFEGCDSVDTKFVEEAALKQTTILLNL